MLGRKIICARQGCRHVNDYFPLIDGSILAKLLLLRLNSAPSEEAPHLYAIDRIAQRVQEFSPGCIDIPQSSIREALLAAAVFHQGPLNAVKMIISDSRTCERSEDVSTHILAAVAFLGKLDIVASLLREGVDVNTNSEYFGSPLRAAAGRGHAQVVWLLLEHGASASNVGGRAAYCHGEDTALQAASRRGDEAIVRLLLEPNYGLQTAGVAYDNAIMEAVRLGHANVVTCLLDKHNSANLGRLQSEMLLVASRYGHIRLVQTILDNGINVNFRGNCDEHALTEAAGGGHALVVSLLLERGTLFNDDEYGNKGALNLAARCGHEDVVRVLLDNGADVNAESGSGFLNPLIEAVRSQNVGTMRLLLDRGADINASECGEYAFSDAIIRGHTEVIRVLVKAGVDIDSTGYPEEPAPILSAMMYGEDRVVELLLELGAKMVNPLTSRWAEEFLNGTYPKKIRDPPPLLRP